MKQRISDRVRQYALDRATYQWSCAFRRWLADDDSTRPFPIVRPFAAGLPPEDARRLTAYALDAVFYGLPETMSAADESETLALSPAGARALAAIQAQGDTLEGDAE